ncbi:MAG: hypothetical protein LQ351_006197 [Letrouitia transgressa]|nr:MAG: hypothetical protein LQ351_006197 [Letrouitia transgressa]
MSSSETSLKINAQKAFIEYKNRKLETLDWTVTEDSIRVRTIKYSTSVLAIAIAIIAGCLSIPFLVRNRIRGVDPFQFVTFSWLLAGAFLVGAKSRYVENWPWHDFLRRQVVCTSVSELAEASRLTKQAVLLYLLRHEFQKNLAFRGPYHSVFRRRSESKTEGFSINVAVDHATVLAAGFIVLEVLETEDTETKVKTVLYDTRKGSSDGIEDKVFVSEWVEPPLNDKSEARMLRCKKIRLTRKKDPLMYEKCKVLGLPVTDCVFV